MSFWVGLLIGLFAGGFMGMLAMGLCVAAGRGDRDELY